MCEYDSTGDTLKHSQRVGELMVAMGTELLERSTRHDRSKTEAPELETFNRTTQRLRDCLYGSDEYNGYLAEMRVALDHHYAANRHHPEHFENGINGMTLIDLVELLADWKAAGERHTTGSMAYSIEFGTERFEISPQLREIIVNTAVHFGMMSQAQADNMQPASGAAA